MLRWGSRNSSQLWRSVRRVCGQIRDFEPARTGTRVASSPGMKTRDWRFIVAVALAGSVWAGVVAGQTVALKRVMQMKLEQSQQILGAMVTSNWAELQRHSEALQQLTRDPAWAVLTTPEYVRQTTAFLRASEDLVDAAKRRDGEAAPLAYVSLTMSCVQCHRYVARARIAGVPH